MGNSQNQKLEDILSMINGLSDEFNAAADNNSKVLDGNVFRGVEQFTSPVDNKLVYYYTSKFPTEPINGVKGVIGVSLDITDRVLAEARLKEANAKIESINLLRNQFILGISHDIKTPFHSIIWFVDLLKDIEEDAKKLEYLNYISLSTKRLVGFIDNLSEVALLDQIIINLI